MDVKNISSVLKGRFIVEPKDGDSFTSVHTSDLLSDVMANAKDQMALVTIQAHKNTIAVCSLLNLPVVVICSNRPVTQDMIDSAIEEGISIFLTEHNQFESSYNLGKALE